MFLPGTERSRRERQVNKPLRETQRRRLMLTPPLEFTNYTGLYVITRYRQDVSPCNEKETRNWSSTAWAQIQIQTFISDISYYYYVVDDYYMYYYVRIIIGSFTYLYLLHLQLEPDWSSALSSSSSPDWSSILTYTHFHEGKIICHYKLNWVQCFGDYSLW